MKTELLEQIQSLTHRQLVRFGRICGVSMGDYMKLGKDELRGKILSFLTDGDGGSGRGSMF